MNETELIAAARSGDEDAFTELYQQHLSYVKAVGRAILRKNDLDDICQDTFLLAFTRLHSFEGNSQFRTWLTRIAVNQCLITLRRERQISNGDSNLIQVDTELLADDVREQCIFASADKQLESVPARLDLDRLLRVLKPFKRRVLEMAYLEGMPEQEIAEILGVEPSCVKRTIHRAKRQVRKMYERGTF
jgi:RNA polymerase sigma-70 factor (ECF subfamily)